MKKEYKLTWLKKIGISSLTMSLLSIVICITCLAGTSWAWFTANESVHIGAIKAANLYINSIKVNEGNVEQENGVYTFDVAANTKYNVVVEVLGNASTGYLMIATPDDNYYTVITNNSFTIIPSINGKVSISASWGSYSEGNAMEFTGENSIIGKGTAQDAYIEQELPAEPTQSEEMQQPAMEENMESKPVEEQSEPEVPESELLEIVENTEIKSSENERIEE